MFVVYFFPETRRRLQLELTGDVFQDAERVVEYALQQQQDVGEGSGLLSEAEENGEEAASRNANETARHLQQAERKRQVLVFEDNLFEGNIQGDDGGPGIQSGIISILSPDNDVTVRNSIFRNNLYGDENVEVRCRIVSYRIAAYYGATLSLPLTLPYLFFVCRWMATRLLIARRLRMDLVLP